MRRVGTVARCDRGRFVPRKSTNTRIHQDHHSGPPRPPLRVRATITSKESEGVGSSLWLLHQHHPRGRCRGLETLMKRAGTRWARAEKFVARTGHAEVLFHT
uniref:Uncharacterized protein n=1 Tax=Phaseolus vulgaris TaxID=3885 RepID=V7AGR6_PHAVU|nr:hypothetical protein PHAVU_011G121500g [Phaseolus vulgaris]ESW04739.1 hypothetical protein PHAVU_011G121500g [Phaseolus vulgaris]